jgi:hypothetical protein
VLLGCCAPGTASELVPASARELVPASAPPPLLLPALAPIPAMPPPPLAPSPPPVLPRPGRSVIAPRLPTWLMPGAAGPGSVSGASACSCGARGEGYSWGQGAAESPGLPYSPSPPSKLRRGTRVASDWGVRAAGARGGLPAEACAPEKDPATMPKPVDCCRGKPCGL